MKLKKLLSTGIILFLLLSFFIWPNQEVDAHTTTCKRGSESLGWLVNCSSHAGKTSYTYRFATDLSATYKSYTSTGASRWNATSIVSIKNVSTSSNLVTSHGGPDTGTVAVTSSWKNATTGHKTRWEISYNRYLMGSRTSTKNNGTATHELGHTIGLGDLYNSSNKNKMMYGYSDRTVYAPTTTDKTGAREAVK
ncbi:M43 family zinc metalloprotease [Planococcus glaciei]|uniref:M43 family zinc metalloprotease n=1 Tax=Planococcus glaciei TaxID=459472 RepID=UPI001C73705A|nr:M43 family zinc metalloprotease [Planococcus glaciei]MBX0314862.1 hypothetical protein [Planococcus glaciei]